MEHMRSEPCFVSPYQHGLTETGLWGTHIAKQPIATLRFWEAVYMRAPARTSKPST